MKSQLDRRTVSASARSMTGLERALDPLLPVPYRSFLALYRFP